MRKSRQQAGQRARTAIDPAGAHQTGIHRYVKERLIVCPLESKYVRDRHTRAAAPARRRPPPAAPSARYLVPLPNEQINIKTERPPRRARLASAPYAFASCPHECISATTVLEYSGAAVNGRGRAAGGGSGGFIGMCGASAAALSILPPRGPRAASHLTRLLHTSEDRRRRGGHGRAGSGRHRGTLHRRGRRPPLQLALMIFLIFSRALIDNVRPARRPPRAAPAAREILTSHALRLKARLLTVNCSAVNVRSFCIQKLMTCEINITNRPTRRPPPPGGKVRGPSRRAPPGAIIIKKCRAPAARKDVRSRGCPTPPAPRANVCIMRDPVRAVWDAGAGDSNWTLRRGTGGGRRGARAGACTLEITAGINHSIIEVSARTRPGTVFVMTRRYCSFLSPLAGPARYAASYEFPLDDLLLY
ncbi:hypothetical protein EVAR_8456_1 [Eumeta japonica]|uniref:Uncharacterized protein n=1 Tax=Eumeta variegata TaxID=151549 RepID=A0A4C1WFD9_EUMVA|nr:hypothetical protein EVAR_8456_1 [Eumeta japonica]